MKTRHINPSYRSLAEPNRYASAARVAEILLDKHATPCPLRLAGLSRDDVVRMTARFRPEVVS